MAFIHDNVRDSGLDYADTNGTALLICSTDPGGTYATATGNQLASETVNTTATADYTPTDGRYVNVPAITAGSITTTGTASHWALTNGTNTIIASGALSATQAVTSGNSFTLDQINIIIRDATAA